MSFFNHTYIKLFFSGLGAISTLIAVVIPELVEPHWYEYLLHNTHAAGLRTLLFLERDQRTVVITTPWYLR